MTSLPLLRARAALLLFVAAAAASSTPLAAQVTQSAGNVSSAATTDPRAKRPLTIADYSRWRSIEAAQLSGDGNWAAYGLRFTNVVTPDAKPELRIKRLDTNAEIVVKDASSPSFSSDSRWIVYQIDPPPPPRGARRGADSTATDSARARPDSAPKRRTELRELATGRTQSWEDIQSATFSPTATHLLLRRRPAARGGAGSGDGASGGGGGGGGGFGGQQSGATPNIRGTDALLHDLATGRTQFLGSVGDAAFNRRGDLLAFSVEAAVKDGNGLFVVDLATGRTHVLDNDARTYSRIAWNDSGTAVAVLKGKDVAKMREKENVLLVVPNVRGAFAGARVAALKLDSTTAGFPKSWVVSDRATLEWSDDSKRVFFGAMRQTPAPDTGKRRSTDSLPDVDVWRTNDERILSLQMIRADADRNFTFREAFDVATGRFVRLADSTMRDVEVAPDGRWAIGRDTRGYISDYGRPRADIYRVNLATGERTLVLKGQMIQQHVFGFSADGRHWLYWKDNKFQSYEPDANVTRTLGGASAPSFVDMEWDYPGTRPSYGVGGFSADGRGVIVNSRYDLWLLPFDGSAARNLTNGEGGRNEIALRYIRTAPVDPMAPRAQRDRRVIDLSRPVTLSAYGEWTKKSGFYTLTGNRIEPVVFEDASFSIPTRAAKADRFLFTRQTFVEFPDLRVSGPAFAQSRKISDANPQQSEFNWGRRVLFDYTLKDGKRAQGIVAIPDDYRDGEKRPMIVSFYEKNSQNMHRHTPPSFLASLNGTPVEAVSKGYLFMLPDVYFRTGQSHSDMLEAVEAATTKVIELGYADPKRIGLHGHSYSGEGAAFIATQSKLFAAVGMGAGVTDLFSDFSQSWGWAYQVNAGSGQNAFEYYLNSQGRWGFSPWEKPEVYRFESALTHAPAVQVPIMIMHGTADPTVAFSEGMNFYSALRYNNKTAYLIAYPGEGHGLRGLANRRDFTIRYFQFFDHYLRGAPAPKWMTDGVPYLMKDEVKEPK